MFFGGGFPFGFGQQGHPDEQEQEETLYSVFGVEEDASTEQITKKYKELKQKYSKGEEADQQKLYEIEEAYELLSDPAERKNYDKSLADQKKIFGMMRGQQEKGPKQQPKMQPMRKQFEVTLDKLYTGGNMPLFHQRARLCDVCDGKGGPDVTQCPDCKGQGATVKMMQVGPGMYTQAEVNCENCNGMGDIFGQGGKCPTCEGRRIVKKGINLEVPIPPGAPAGHVITIEKQGNEVNGLRAGDLMLHVKEAPHDVYTRKGADLFIKKSVSLVEALLGFNFQITHLDGKKHSIYTRPGDVIGDGSKKIVKQLGMPFFDQPASKGNLVIEFRVIMPKRGELNPEQLKVLTSALPGKIDQRPKDDQYEMLDDFDRQLLNTNEEGGKKEQDVGEQQEGQQGGISCNPQ